MSIACSIVCITLMVSDRRWFTRKFRTCSNYRLSKTLRAGNQTKSYDTLHHGRGLLTRQVKHQVVHRSIDIITKARNTKESVCMFRSKYVMYFFRNLLNNFFAHKALKFTTNNNEKSCASPRWTYIKNKNSAKYTNLQAIPPYINLCLLLYRYPAFKA